MDAPVLVTFSRALALDGLAVTGSSMALATDQQGPTLKEGCHPKDKHKVETTVVQTCVCV